MNIVKRPIEELRLNPDNPRFIKEDKYKKLLASIREFPEMLDLRPIVVDSEGIVLGGNMRLRACKEAGLKEVPVIYADQLTEEQKREFIIKDNVGFGEWDWDVLANEWDAVVLDAWGLDVPHIDDIEETKDIPETGEVEFSQELLLEHNYIVLYFDNPLDWEVAQEKYGLKITKSNDPASGVQKYGIGRVINGKDFI